MRRAPTMGPSSGTYEGCRQRTSMLLAEAAPSSSTLAVLRWRSHDSARMNGSVLPGLLCRFPDRLRRYINPLR